MQHSVPSTWPYSEYSEYVETSLHAWHIQRLGKSGGKKILFIHGTGSSCHTWSDTVEYLLDEFEVLLVDLPGHGFSKIPAPNQSSLQSIFNGSMELIKKIPFVPDLIVGHSAGAAIAVLLSEKIKAKSGVICINAAFGEFPGLAGVMFPIFAKIIAVVPFSSDVLAGLSKNKERTEKLIANTGSTITKDNLNLYKVLFSKPNHVKGTLKLMAEWNLSEFLENLKNCNSNINFLVGNLDKTVPISISKKWSQILPRTSYYEISGAGHLVHEEKPYEVSQIILNHLQAIKK
jgi:magnesium chelatase accessory protein